MRSFIKDLMINQKEAENESLLKAKQDIEALRVDAEKLSKLQNLDELCGTIKIMNHRIVSLPEYSSKDAKIMVSQVFKPLLKQLLRLPPAQLSNRSEYEQMICNLLIRLIQLLEKHGQVEDILDVISYLLNEKSQFFQSLNESKSLIYKYQAYDESDFYKILCQKTIEQLNLIVKVIWKLRPHQICSLLKSIHNYKHRIHANMLIEETIDNYLTELYAYAKSGRKSLIAFADQQFFKNLLDCFSDHGAIPSIGTSITKRINMLGPWLAIELIGNQDVKMKEAGINLLDRISNDISLHCHKIKDVSMEEFIQLLINNNVFEKMYSPEVPDHLLVKSLSILKIYSLNGFVKDDNLTIILNLISSNQSSKVLKVVFYKGIEVHRLTQQEKIKVLNFMHEKLPLDEDWMSLFEQLSKSKGNMNYANKVFDSFNDILVKFETLTEHLKKKVLDRSLVILEGHRSKIKENNFNFTNSDLQNELCLKTFTDFLVSKSLGNLLFIKKIAEDDYFNKFLSYSNTKKVISQIILDKKFLQKSFDIMETHPHYEIHFQKILEYLVRYHSFSSSHSKKLMYKLLKYSSLFDLFLDKCGHQFAKESFGPLVEKLETDYIPFKALKKLFCKINYCRVQNYQDDIGKKMDIVFSKDNPKFFNYYDDIVKIAKQSKFEDVRKDATDFLVEIFVNFQNKGYYEINGQKHLMNFIDEIVEKVNKKQSENELTYTLNSLKTLLNLTDSLGPSIYRPHKSIVSLSSIHFSVVNMVTFGDDVDKILVCNFPSGFVFFDVLMYLGKRFKCGPEDLELKEETTGRILRCWCNGLPIDEINIHGKTLVAQINPIIKLKSDPLFVEGKFTSKAKVCLQKIFQKFAYDGKMSLLECIKYFKEATKSEFTINDYRVKELAVNEDLDNDDIIKQEDFLRYHSKKFDSFPISSKDKLMNEFRNFRFRRNLSDYDQEINYHEWHHLMLRHRVKDNQQFYGKIVELLKSENLNIRAKAENLLLHLPTVPKILSDVKGKIQLEDLSEFEVYYRLIAVLRSLNDLALDETFFQEKLQKIKNFKKLENHIQILNLLKKFKEKEHPTGDTNNYQQKCYLICFQILRSLIILPSLVCYDGRYLEWFNRQDLQFLEHTDLFQVQMIKALEFKDIVKLEFSLCLQLTQQNINIELIVKNCFNEIAEIRQIFCIFLFWWSIKSDFKYNIFKTPQYLLSCESETESYRCVEWFGLLNNLLDSEVGKKYLNEEQILNQTLDKIKQRKEENLKNSYDIIMYGYLKLAESLILKEIKYDPEILQQILLHLLNNTFSPQNRSLLFNIMIKTDIKAALTYMKSLLTNSKPQRQCEVRSSYMGIKNLGATCYMNSLLQQLFWVKKFRDLVFKEDIKGEVQYQKIEKDGVSSIDDFLYQLKKMYYYLQYSQRKHYNPTEFCLTIKTKENDKIMPINTAIQEDSHEFMIKLFTELQSYLKLSDHLIDLEDIFGGKTNTFFECCMCKNKISKLEHFYSLTLEVKNLDNLEGCLNKFIEQETIQDYKCQICNKKSQKITRITLLNKLPQILVLNLKRSFFDPLKFQTTKLASRIEFPKELDLKTYIEPQQYSDQSKEFSTKYRLKGIVIHTGNYEGGHYYSAIKINGVWHKFNDKTVSVFDEVDLWRESFGGKETQSGFGDVSYSTNASCLFYEKVEDIKQIQSQTKIMQVEQLSQQPMSQEKANNISVKSPQKMLQLQQNIFTTQIQNDNFALLHEYKTHQQSFFTSIIYAYEMYRPKWIEEHIKHYHFYQDWEHHQHKEIFEQLVEIYLRAFEFLNVFGGLKKENKELIRLYVLQLLCLVPQASFKYLTNFRAEVFLDRIVKETNVQTRIQTKQLFVRIIQIYVQFYGVDLNQKTQYGEKIIKIFTNLYEYYNIHCLSTNLSRSLTYFEMQLQLLKFDDIFLKFFIEKDFIHLVYQVLMGKYEEECIYKTTQRPSIGIWDCISLMVLNIVKRSRNLAGYEIPNGKQIMQMSEKVKQCLQNVRFLKQMLVHYNNNYLSEILNILCFKDFSFSTKIIDILLYYLSPSSFVQNMFHVIDLLFKNIAFILILDDQFTLRRYQLILGVPQLIYHGKEEFGVVQSEDGSYIKYEVPIFGKKYRFCLLQVLFEEAQEKKFSDFAAEALMFIIQLSEENLKFQNYILNLPSQKFCELIVFDWIHNFVEGFEKDGKLTQKWLQRKLKITFKEAYSSIIQKVKKSLLEHPLQRNIIGKNTKFDKVEEKSTEKYCAQIFRHRSFCLTASSDIQKSDFHKMGQFKSEQTKGIAPFFVHYSMGIEPECPQPPQKNSTLTIKLKAKTQLKVRFLSLAFSSTFYFLQGQHLINIPYIEKQWQDLVEVTDWQFNEVQFEEKKPESKDGSKMEEQKTDEMMVHNQNQFIDTFQIECRHCTFKNQLDAQICAVCYKSVYF